MRIAANHMCHCLDGHTADVDDAVSLKTGDTRGLRTCPRAGPSRACTRGGVLCVCGGARRWASTQRSRLNETKRCTSLRQDFGEEIRIRRGCSSHEGCQPPGLLGQFRASSLRIPTGRRRRHFHRCACEVRVWGQGVPADSLLRGGARWRGCAQAYTSQRFLSQPWHAHACSLCARVEQPHS